MFACLAGYVMRENQVDDADRAKVLEMRERQQSILNQLATPDHAPGEKPLIVGGEHYCLDCAEPISKERLKAHPGAVRCVSCKSLWEKENS